MPVARSDPRRATVIGIVGIVVGTLLIIVVLVVNNLGNDRSTVQTTRTKFDVGPADSSANAIKRDDTPLLFQDPATFSRPIFVQHIGDDPATGWTAFDAAVGKCVLTWHAESRDFSDCNGRRYPADGSGAHQYPVTVVNNELLVDLSVDATTTTTPTTTATTVPASTSTPG